LENFQVRKKKNKNKKEKRKLCGALLVPRLSGHLGVGIYLSPLQVFTG